MAELPSGTVTFLFTDLEGSTRLWEEYPDAMPGALVRHDAIVRGAIEGHGGAVLSEMGDGMAGVFASPLAAVAAAVQAQCGLVDEPWGEVGALRARMGLHSGEGALRADGHYVNAPLNRCARLMAAAHGGQVLISDTVEALVRDGLAPPVAIVDLGKHRLRDVAEPIQVFQVVHPLLESEFPPLRSVGDVPGNLPRQVTSFVGRERELASLTSLVRERQLVTLTGVGGVGKTRLALEAALDVLSEFPDGAWLCELAPVVDPDAVWEILATSLGVQRHPTRPLDSVILGYLGSKRLLLVLDNCEHLLDAAARVVDAITRRAPEVVILVTSREGLAVAGEHLVAVPALGVPRENDGRNDFADSDAVQLFVDRARDAQPDFALGPDNLEAVAQLCRRLDGIPLAIELAAARVRTLTPDDLVARLDQRFRLLTRGSRAALARHQTLRNTVDWSYNLLSKDEQVGLNRLSVFAGGCDLDAAEAILAPDGEFDAIEVLSQLVDKSLAIADDETGSRRYRMFETIRQYAQDQLEASGESAQTRRNHAEYFVALAERAGPHLRDRSQLEWAAKLARDSDNLRTALDWAIELASADHALRLVVPFMVVGLPMGWTITDWADLAVAVPGADTHSLYPAVVAYVARGAGIRNERDRAQHLAALSQEAQRVLGTDHLWVDQAAGVVAVFQGDLDTAAAHGETWLSAARERNDHYEIAHALSLIATGLRLADPPRAEAAADEAIHLAREHGIGSALLYALLIRTLLPTDPGEALEMLDEATTVAMTLGDHYGAARTDGARGVVAMRAGEWRIALQSFVRGAGHTLAGDETLLVLPEASVGAAIALAHLGALEDAAMMLSFADSNYAEIPRDSSATLIMAEARELVRDGVSDIELARLTARGASLSTRDAIALMRDASESHPRKRPTA